MNACFSVSFCFLISFICPFYLFTLISLSALLFLLSPCLRFFLNLCGVSLLSQCALKLRKPCDIVLYSVTFLAFSSVKGNNNSINIKNDKDAVAAYNQISLCGLFPCNKERTLKNINKRLRDKDAWIFLVLTYVLF